MSLHRWSRSCNVPVESFIDRLKARAAIDGMSMSDVTSCAEVGKALGPLSTRQEVLHLQTAIDPSPSDVRRKPAVIRQERPKRGDRCSMPRPRSSRQPARSGTTHIAAAMDFDPHRRSRPSASPVPSSIRRGPAPCAASSRVRMTSTAGRGGPQVAFEDLGDQVDSSDIRTNPCSNALGARELQPRSHDDAITIVVGSVIPTSVHLQLTQAKIARYCDGVGSVFACLT